MLIGILGSDCALIYGDDDYSFENKILAFNLFLASICLNLTIKDVIDVGRDVIMDILKLF